MNAAERILTVDQRSIKGSFDGTLPRMSALCGVYPRITTVKYGDGIVEQWGK